jgi:DNA repair protein RadC
MRPKRTLKPRGCSLGAEQRRLMTHGPEALAPVELVACVIGGPVAIERAIAVLHGAGGLRALERAEPWQVCRAAGARPAEAAALVAAVELGRRVARVATPYARTIKGPSDVAELLRATIGHLPRESFIVLGLDTRQRLRMVRTVAVGAVAGVVVHPRDVFAPFIGAGIHGLILAHNHPTGDPEPSDADVVLTHRMSAAGRMLGMPVLDHVIVTRAGAVSLAALGVLEPSIG